MSLNKTSDQLVQKTKQPLNKIPDNPIYLPKILLHFQLHD
uniref:Uncharacterized protein n=1 Tax=Lepeophtheirus salmonis TaxID=72036 RepID=A0A0K2VG32_LEPSM